MSRVLIAWYFIALSGWGGTQYGPFQTQQQCNQMRQELIRDMRAVAKQCWEVKP